MEAERLTQSQAKRKREDDAEKAARTNASISNYFNAGSHKPAAKSQAKSKVRSHSAT